MYTGKIATRRKARIITLEEEELMWQKNVLGSDNPQTLSDTIFYLIGLNFAFRAVADHRALRISPVSQLSLQIDENGQEYLMYKEEVSKANQGGIQHRKIKPKTVRAYANDENPERCIVRIYKLYVSKLPDDLPDDAFYFRPHPNYDESGPWFTRQVIGVAKLGQIVKEMCVKAGIKGHRTNHSLRATAATRLYDQEFDEQLVCETTGHRSNSVRDYKRTSCALKRKANLAVQGIVSHSKRDDSLEREAEPPVKKKRACPTSSLGAPPCESVVPPDKRSPTPPPDVQGQASTLPDVPVAARSPTPPATTPTAVKPFVPKRTFVWPEKPPKRTFVWPEKSPSANVPSVSTTVTTVTNNVAGNVYHQHFHFHM